MKEWPTLLTLPIQAFKNKCKLRGKVEEGTCKVPTPPL